ncbi:MAG: iron dependent repressor, metal binding and dimerization domain protein [Bacilli bacterium]|nr:iron dependent repressor, metal binding and dimerization domain protein [Bacilli bacterium]
MKNKFHTVRGYELQNSQKKITPAMEDYIEMIYRNSLDEDFIRVNQLAKLLNVKSSSVTKMIQKLGALELVNYEKYGVVTLTSKGKKLGSHLLKRHITIEKFLDLIGCKENILIQTELIEHIIDNKTVKALETLNNFFLNHKNILEIYNIFKDNNL